MKYQQKDFTEELRSKIKNNELAFEKHIEKILNENKTVFAKKKLEFNADFAKEGDDPFMPVYTSSIAIGIKDNTNKNSELNELHIIKIWECGRTLLGMPISKNIPGSKISGELLDESLKKLKRN